MNVKAYAQGHPLVAYFVLAYAITWSGILLVFASVGFQTGAVGVPQIGLMFLAMVAGPSLSSALWISLLDGKAGWRDLGARLGRWRLGLGWYAAALLTVPLVVLAILSALSLFYSPAFRPGFTPALFVIGLVAGFFEEIGWTGFALPRLGARRNTFMAGLLLGLLWAFWHIAADGVGNLHAMGAAWLPHFLVYWIVPLTAYRILMAWVYKNTHSLLLAQLMHAGYTGSLLVLTPPAASLADNFVWEPIFALALWAAVAVVAVAYGPSLARGKASLAA